MSEKTSEQTLLNKLLLKRPHGAAAEKEAVPAKRLKAFAAGEAGERPFSRRRRKRKPEGWTWSRRRSGKGWTRKSEGWKGCCSMKPTRWSSKRHRSVPKLKLARSGRWRIAFATRRRSIAAPVNQGLLLTERSQRTQYRPLACSRHHRVADYPTPAVWRNRQRNKQFCCTIKGCPASVLNVWHNRMVSEHEHQPIESWSQTKRLFWSA